MNDHRPRPVTDDHDTAGFWTAAHQGQLAVLVCRSCNQAVHLPRRYCGSCRSWATEWRVVRPRARLYSWTVVEQQVHGSFPAPYTIVLVELDDMPGIRLVGHLSGIRELCIGIPMRAVFERLDDDAVLPQWEPVVDTTADS